jgi:hypothetical protein
MTTQEKIEKVSAEHKQALQQIANLQAFCQQCVGKLTVLNELLKEETEIQTPTTNE